MDAAMATMNISLPEPLKDWVEAQTRTGRYANASDYVRDLIRRDQERAAKIGKLQTMITEGIESEDSGPLDLEGFLADMHARHAGKKA
ncbi:MAG TPA: type II toxin-antitoxin system ParD family antitoxin [Terricaulis sp.]|nr:type II toxin-antitoxin system ParD family antitoxin [Terricaulis sp.]HRP10081.1 type II toxin-antitoxin system ParD family antitoxin [Terricaulis sp.]